MTDTATAALQRAYQLIKAGNKRAARAILLPILRADQDVADAWYLLAHALADPRKRLISFQEVLRLDPGNLSAKKQVARLLAAQAAAQRKKVRKQAALGLAFGSLGMLGAVTFLLALMVIGNGWFSRPQAAAAAPLSVTVRGTLTSPPTHPPTATSIPPQLTTTQPAVLTSSPTAIIETIVPTATPDVRLTAKRWREWPNVPTLSARAQGILLAAHRHPDIDLHAFSRVGDCQLTTGTFLGGYVTGAYPIPQPFSPTVAYFSSSFTTESITAANGMGVNSVLNPIFAAGAGHHECSADETPLNCELRIRRPAVVVVAMGTNWVPHAEVSYERYLRQVVERILQTGALPILATKADNIEGDWKLNESAAQVAYDYDLPLVNVWRSVQDLPNRGLESPKNIYLTGDAWMRRNSVWLQTLDETRWFLTQKTGG